MRVAVVGTGGVAQRHLGVFPRIGGLEVVGHLSQDLSRASAQAQAWGGRAYTHLDRLLDHEQPEAVWVCVTPDRHGAIEAALIDRGIPFFVEKPLSVDLATAEAIAAALAQRPVLAAVGYRFRALDTLPRVRALLAERPARMVIGAWHDAMPPPAWWRDATRGGGQIVEQVTHLVDLARLLVGEAQVVSASGGRWPRADYPDSTVADVSAAHLRFVESGVPGLLSATCLLDGQQAIWLQLICEGRVLTISERALRIDTGRQVEDIPTAADPFEVEDAAFLRAIRHADPSAILCSYADALQTHALCWQIQARMNTAAVG